MKPQVWQAKELQKRFSDVWQLKDLLAKLKKPECSTPDSERSFGRDASPQDSYPFFLAGCKYSPHPFSWAGCKYSPHPIGYSIVKERNESGPAASQQKH